MISYYSNADKEDYTVGIEGSLDGTEVVSIDDLGTGSKLKLHLKIEPPKEEEKQSEIPLQAVINQPAPNKVKNDSLINQPDQKEKKQPKQEHKQLSEQ